LTEFLTTCKNIQGNRSRKERKRSTVKAMRVTRNWLRNEEAVRDVEVGKRGRRGGGGNQRMRLSEKEKTADGGSCWRKHVSEVRKSPRAN
jgi:hypothetical protein